jgi:large subunit ribosomal protein L10
MAIVAKKIHEEKTKAIADLKEELSASQDFIFADYRGLTVAQITNLRRQMAAKGAHFKVAKNKFARIAFDQLKTPDVSQYLKGPTAIAIAPQDSNEVAKIMLAFVKDAPVLNVKGGLVGGTVYDAAQVEAFSKLPGKKQLISMLMSVMNGPVRNLAAALNDVPSRLVRTVKAIADQKAAAGGQAAPAAAA